MYIFNFILHLIYIYIFRLLDTWHCGFFTFYRFIYSPLCGHMDIIFTWKMTMMDAWHKTVGGEVVFDQFSHASYHDHALMQGTLGYVGKIQEIVQVDFSSFQCVTFMCKWWDTFYRKYLSSLERCGMELGRLMFSQNTATNWLFYPDVLDRDWWFVWRHDPRSKHIFEKNSVVMPSKEDNQGDDNGEWYVLVLFHHLYYCCMFCFIYFVNYTIILFVLLEFYIIGKIHKHFYTFFVVEIFLHLKVSISNCVQYLL